MPVSRRIALVPTLLACATGIAAAFTPGTLYTLKTQAILSEPGRTDTGWYFNADASGGTYPRTTTPMREGGLSDLVLDPSDATGHTFWSVQDRGLATSYDAPGSGDTAYKIFAFPGHHQKIVRIRVTGDSVETLARDSIGGIDTGYTTGLPSTRVPVEEVAIRMRLDSARVDVSPARRVPPSPNGYDFEAIARAPDGTLYLADEMGPRIVRVNAATKRIDREWRPGDGLPRVFARRRDNRGLEALCLTPSGKLAGLMQGGLYNTVGGKRSNAKDSTRVLRFFLLDPATDAIREHVYLADLKDGNRKPGEVKISTMACLGDSSFLVVEHGKDKDDHHWIDLFRADLTPQTSDVHEPGDAFGEGRLFMGGLKTLEQVGYIPGDSATLASVGVTPMAKRLVYGDIIGRTAWRHESPEGLAVVNDSVVAILNDNDYAQSDDDGDGIPHLTGNNKRRTQLMYLVVGKGNLTAGTIGAATGRRAPSLFRVTARPDGWVVRGPAGMTVWRTDVRGRREPVPVADGTAFVAAGGAPGIRLLELRHGDHRETHRLFVP